MTQIDDAQALAATNAHADTADDPAGGSVAVPVATDAQLAAVQTFVSGTAKQVSASRAAELYINITTAASLKVEMGATSSVANTISVAQSSALGVITLRVPAGWYVKLTGTMADVTCTSVLA